MTAKRLAVHVLSNGLGAPLYWFGSALLGSISLKTHSIVRCVCESRFVRSTSSFSTFMFVWFHIPKTGGRPLLPLDPQIHGRLCITSNSITHTEYFTCVRVAPTLRPMDSSHLVPASPSTVCIGTSIAPAAAAHMLVVYVFVSEEVIVDATLAICSIAAR